VEPGKESRKLTRTWMLKNDVKSIGIGLPGGKRIPIIMADVLFKYLIEDEELEDAIEADRVFVVDEKVLTEMDLDEDTKEKLESYGYEVYTNDTDAEFYGGIQALVVDEESQSVYGGADKRRDGTWQVKEMEKYEVLFILKKTIKFLWPVLLLFLALGFMTKFKHLNVSTDM